MKRIFIALTLILLLTGCTYAVNSTVNINGADFDIPSEYQGGEMIANGYILENIFSILRVDDNVPNAVGLWASENDFSEDLNIADHPVRHYCQYNGYLDDNMSHAYFPSDKSVYEIKWTGNEITPSIEKLINNTPASKISDEDFYNVLDKSVDIYKKQKIERLNSDGEYNYMESKIMSEHRQDDTSDDTRFKEILLTYYR